MRVDRVEHGLDVPHHVGVGETKDAKALGFHDLAPPEIVSSLCLEAVLTAVDLDDEPLGEAAKIGNEGTDRNLSSEVRTQDRETVAQMPPETLLGFGRRTPKRSSVSGRFCRHERPRRPAPGHPITPMMTR
jgi:hypothetical protein